MKATGIVRKVDELGRVCLPMELRNILGIDKKDPLEIYIDDEKIILKKHEPGCIFCSKVNDIIVFRGKNVCRVCARIQGQAADELKPEETTDKEIHNEMGTT